MKPIKVLIADDQTLMRDGLKYMLSLENDMEVVGTTETGTLAYEMTARIQPNVVITDIKVKGMEMIENIRLIKKDFPNTVIIMLTTYEEEEYIFEALYSGASGYLLKNMPRENLVRAIRDCASGNVSMPVGLMQKLTARMCNLGSNPLNNRRMLIDELTERELQMAKLMIQGYTNKQIASREFITEGTVKNYISSIYSKIGINDRTRAVIYLKEHCVQ